MTKLLYYIFVLQILIVLIIFYTDTGTRAQGLIKLMLTPFSNSQPLPSIEMTCLNGVYSYLIK